jgi:mono/diheme cytochrome c family protein
MYINACRVQISEVLAIGRERKPMKWQRRTAAAICGWAFGLSLGVGVAVGQSGDAFRGEALAEAWCAQCHIIDARGRGRTADMAPPFPTIAGHPAKTPDYLRGWLIREHPRMPDFNLGRQDIDDLIAFIRTLPQK